MSVQNVSVPRSKERFLPPGEQITLWLELQLPDTSQYDIFQVQRLQTDLCFNMNMDKRCEFLWSSRWHHRIQVLK
jgi:hypothetical protein